jgi:hypothetical protein
MLIALGVSAFLTFVERVRYHFSAHKRGSASHNDFGHGAEHDDAAHGARHSDADGRECIAEVAIPAAVKGAGEMPCGVRISSMIVKL